MPVPKLSRRFYEVFGDEVANQLVTWFNDVDTTYRDELRALNAANAERVEAIGARLEARVDQRIAELQADLRTEFHREIAGLRGEFHKEMGALRGEFHKEMGALRGDLIRWTFMFWVGNTVTTVGLVFAMLKLML
jgi:ABC-type phosphate transport system auxiliary subunit